MLTELESRYPIGSNLTIMNTYYNYPMFDEGKKVLDDFLVIVYKNNDTGKSEYKIIPRPEYTYYKIKPGYEADYSRLFIEKDKVDPVTVKFTDIEKSIAEQTGNVEFYKQNLANRNKSENRKLHTNPDIFFSDVNIEDHYRFKFANSYSNEICKLNKAYFDIEVDGKFAAGDFVEHGEVPINAVSFMDDKSDTVYTFILRDQRNPLIEQFENEIKSGQFDFNIIHQFVIDNVGGLKMAKKYKLLNTKFCLQFYDYEIELIRDLFKTIHTCKPDFVLTWNGNAFDIEYIIERCKVLGYDPAEILCDQSWPVKVVKNYIDHKHINEIAERGDYTFISGIPLFVDQMIQYGSRRKSKIGSYKSFKLDDIGLLEAGVRKLDYHHITKNITELPWLDFKTFILYNIMDVIVQKCIEIKTNDMEYIFSKCLVNNTVYPKGHRQTIYLINRMAADWYKMGYIIGNNINKWNEKPPKFLGALVGNPLNTNDYSKLKINGRAIWICDNLQDYDYKSLYPSIMLEFNIAPNTQVGRIIIPEPVYIHENAYHLDKYSRSGEFIENMVTDNHIEFCHRWMHLANFMEFVEDFNEYYSDRGLGNLSTIFNDGHKESPILPCYDGKENPIEFVDNIVEKPIIFYTPKPKELSYNIIVNGKGVA